MHVFSVIPGILDCVKCRLCKKYFIAVAAALSVPVWSVHVLLVCGLQGDQMQPVHITASHCGVKIHKKNIVPWLCLS